MDGGTAAARPLDHAPSGTLTFLFSDSESSTERWERNDAAMEEALGREALEARAAQLEYDEIIELALEV